MEAGKLKDTPNYIQHYPYLKESMNRSPSSSLTFNSSESDDETKREEEEEESDSDFYETTIAPQEVHHMNKLQLDHQYLSEQNRVLMRELACAKMTAQALRSIIVQKDEQLTQLAKELPNLNLASLNSVKLSNSTTIETIVEPQPAVDNLDNKIDVEPSKSKGKGDVKDGSKMKMPFRFRGLSSKST